jgi:hypothetical protein
VVTESQSKGKPVSLHNDSTIPQESTSNDLLSSLPIEQNLSSLRWHQKIRWRAVFFGLAISSILLIYTLNSTSPYGVFGLSGYLNNAIIQGFTNIIIYFFVYLIFGSIWRKIFKKSFEQNENKRKMILSWEVFFVVISCFLIILSLIGIEGLILRSNVSSNPELTINLPVTSPTSTSIPSSTPIPAIINIMPTKDIPPTKTPLTAQEVILLANLMTYKHEDSIKNSGWIVQTYLDGITIDIEKNYVTITLSKSPVTEKDFNELAYELIVLTANLTGAKEDDKNPSGSAPWDWNIYGVKVISRDMADYTISGFVEGHNNLAEMAESKDTRHMVEYEKYYE